MSIPPLLAQLAPGLLAVVIAFGGWLVMKRAHRNLQNSRSRSRLP